MPLMISWSFFTEPGARGYTDRVQRTDHQERLLQDPPNGNYVQLQHMHRAHWPDLHNHFITCTFFTHKNILCIIYTGNIQLYTNVWHSYSRYACSSTCGHKLWLYKPPKCVWYDYNAYYICCCILFCCFAGTYIYSLYIPHPKCILYIKLNKLVWQGYEQQLLKVYNYIVYTECVCIIVCHGAGSSFCITIRSLQHGLQVTTGLFFCTYSQSCFLTWAKWIQRHSNVRVGVCKCL